MDDEKLVEDLGKAVQAAWDGVVSLPPIDLTPDERRLLARHLLPIIAREVAAETERCARVAEKTTAYDDNLQRSAGCGTTGQRIAAAIRGRATNAAMDAE